MPTELAGKPMALETPADEYYCIDHRVSNSGSEMYDVDAGITSDRNVSQAAAA